MQKIYGIQGQKLYGIQGVYIMQKILCQICKGERRRKLLINGVKRFFLGFKLTRK